MFTGIVEETGTLEVIESNRLAIRACTVLGDLKVGDSICVGGACLTVISKQRHSFSMDVVPETLRRTTLGSLKAGDRVNLERSVSVGGRFGGHILQGHVDATGRVESIADDGEAKLVKLEAPPLVMRYVVEKGFVAVDGVSLTVVNCDSRYFTVTLIPHTRHHTTLGGLKRGDSVNLEADIIAKYVERLSSTPRMPL